MLTIVMIWVVGASVTAYTVGRYTGGTRMDSAVAATFWPFLLPILGAYALYDFGRRHRKPSR